MWCTGQSATHTSKTRNAICSNCTRSTPRICWQYPYPKCRPTRIFSRKSEWRSEWSLYVYERNTLAQYRLDLNDKEPARRAPQPSLRWSPLRWSALRCEAPSSEPLSAALLASAVFKHAAPRHSHTQSRCLRFRFTSVEASDWSVNNLSFLLTL